MAFTLFTENDLTRVIKYLEINPFTPKGEEYVRIQMERTEDSLPNLVPEIQADLNTLDTLDAALTTEQGSTNAALIKADVLEWEPGGARIRGLHAEAARLKTRLRSLLGLAANGGSKMGTLMRG